mmetsp:Transcript_31533/g.46021  ORF Transcript_31533/g.46021 Transcript_31533/m.46021 type:complete len:123 (-) Transcript_31533:49-417(-)
MFPSTLPHYTVFGKEKSLSKCINIYFIDSLYKRLKINKDTPGQFYTKYHTKYLADRKSFIFLFALCKWLVFQRTHWSIENTESKHQIDGKTLFYMLKRRIICNPTTCLANKQRNEMFSSILI